MSRIIVKNIPKHLDESRFKSIFEKCGQVTDVRIIFRENKNRRFGFVGNINYKLFNGIFSKATERKMQLRRLASNMIRRLLILQEFQ